MGILLVRNQTDFTDTMTDEGPQSDRANMNKPQNVDNSVGGTSDASLKKEFDMIDLDKSGYIDKKDIQKMFGSWVPESMVTKAISLIDTNKDGKISFEEYKIIRKQIGAVKLPTGFGKKN